MKGIGVGTKANQYYAYFTVVGEFDPNEITARLGMEPTDCWKKGDRNERTHLERKFSRWSLYSLLDRSAALEEHVSNVVGRLLPHAEAVSKLEPEFAAGIQLVGYFHSSYPGFGLETSVIAELAELKLGFDCDFYYMYSDRREDS